MALQFERGDPAKPKGHALVYFRVLSSPDKILASYVVIFPLPLDMSKYVPPFLASQFGNINIKDMPAFSLPPVPEEVESYEHITRLAALRDDDLVFGGDISSRADVTELMQRLGDMAQEYTHLWGEYLKAAPRLIGVQPADERGVSVSEVLYGLMSERDRLVELSKLVGKLRFAITSLDSSTAMEIEEEILALGKHLPPNYRLEGLLQAAKDTSGKGLELVQLYIDRCYKLADGKTQEAAHIEEEISSLQDTT